jgi:hypothetical protein
MKTIEEKSIMAKYEMRFIIENEEYVHNIKTDWEDCIDVETESDAINLAVNKASEIYNNECESEEQGTPPSVKQIMTELEIDENEANEIRSDALYDWISYEVREKETKKEVFLSEI